MENQGAGESVEEGSDQHKHVNGCPLVYAGIPTRITTRDTFSVAKRKRAHGEGSVFWDKARDRWMGEIRIDGRVRKVSAKTQTDAAAKLGKLIHGDPAERHVDRRATVASLLEDWQTIALPGKNLAPKTLENHQWIATRWADQIGGAKVADLDVTTVERALRNMGPMSKATLVKARSTLSQALEWGQRRRVVAFNAAAAAELPVDSAPTRDKNSLSADQLAKLLDALAEHPWRSMYALSGRVGLRPGEAAAVCLDSLDLDGEPPTVAVTRGVRVEKGRPVLVDDLKTAGARRTLALPADMVSMLTITAEMADPDTGMLFTARAGGPVWPSTARSELAKACAAAGIPKVTPNELRHTCATLLVDSGLLPHQVADLLGHRSTRMIDATYRHRPAVVMGADTVTP
jgi:integrase